MTFKSKKNAVILFNLGGPDAPESVKPFLFNLFNDKAIIGLPQPFRYLLAKLISGRRDKTAREIYSHLGGKSPLLELTEKQADSLEKELSFFGEFKTFIAMRYWHPFSSQTIEKVIKYNPDNLILLPLYPQYSTSTTKSSINDFINQVKKNKNSFKSTLNTNIVCCYPESEKFIKSHASLIKKAVIRDYDKDLNKFRFLFSAHGLPQKLIDKGDPYQLQVEMTTKKVVNELAKIFNLKADEMDYQTCYQSKVGPLQWTTPSLGDEIHRISKDNKIPVIIPIAFVSDHSETLVELDIEYKEMAEKLGIKKYIRVPALNSNQYFIDSLVDICKNIANNSALSNAPKYFSDLKNQRICPKSFKLCQNPQRCSN